MMTGVCHLATPSNAVEVALQIQRRAKRLSDAPVLPADLSGRSIGLQSQCRLFYGCQPQQVVFLDM